MKKAVEVKNLTKQYKELTALDNVSFEVKEGEILGLLGPNGSGKSTTINCLLSLLAYDDGEIKIFGKKMHPDAVDLKKQIGVVFQDVAVFDELTVHDNIDYFCGLYIDDKTTRAKYIKEAIELVGLADFVDFKPKKLSGGLLRRLNIACGIAHKPKLIFFDEPTVAVDPQSRNNILESIKTLNKNGATIVYTTHYMEEVDQLCDRIIILDHGKIIAEGTSESLKKSIGVGEKITLSVPSMAIKNEREIAKLPSVKELSKKEGDLVIVYEKTAKKSLVKLVEYLDKSNIEYNDIFSEQPTLNDVFLELTGKDLRD